MSGGRLPVLKGAEFTMGHEFSALRRMIRSGVAAVIMLLAAPTAAFSHEAVTSGMVNMRAGPDRDFPIVTVLGVGARLQVQGCLSDYRWCDVIAGGARGWVHAGYITYPYQGRQVVVVDYGPSLALPIATFALGVYWADHYRRYPWYHQHRHWHSWHYRPHPPPAHRPPPPAHRPPAHRPPPPPAHRPPPPPAPGQRPPSGQRPPPGKQPPAAQQPLPGPQPR